MKKIVSIILINFLFTSIVGAQNYYSNYDKLWSEVEGFELKALPKSTLEVVDKIYVKAKESENSPQLVKALIYKSKFALTLDEDAQLKIINDFKTEISNTEFPTKNILESVLANLYWQYFQQNRWKFYNRTKVVSEVLEDTKQDTSSTSVSDFRTWDLQTIFNEIHIHFQNSLQNGLVAQLKELNEFDAILTIQENSKKFRPTLFDFLNHNALEFYKTSETHITKPSYKFEINNKETLDNSHVFSMLKFSTKDSLSLQLNALHIYQNLIDFHTKNKNEDASISIDLERLNFVKTNAAFKNKDSLHLKSLYNLKARFSTNESTTLIDFEIASIYNNSANQYIAGTNTNNQFDRAKALEICNNAIVKFPKSVGAKKCSVLKQQIENKQFRITTEKNIPVKKYSKVLVNYKNIESLYFKVYEISTAKINKFHKTHSDEEKIAFINQLKLVDSFQQSLKTENDYQNHRTEISIPPLKNGQYLVVVSQIKTIKKENLYATAVLQSTNISITEFRQKNTTVFQVIDRNNGEPISNASVNLKNYNTGRYNNPIDEDFITDNKGQLKFNASERHRHVIITVKKNGKKAIFGDYYLDSSRNYNHRNDKKTIQPFLFTDRSIYRPGQTVFFKGIFIEKDQSNSTVFSNEKVSAILYNVNHEKIKEFELTTNEFGAINGEFILPNNGLLGQYSIRLPASKKTSQNFYFSVEEYKRPKFEASFKPITETYKINDSISIHGIANAFSGSSISGAKVVYRVHRKVQYPRWFYWYRPSFNTSEPQEIIHGETKTDAQGSFNIKFKSLADKSVNKKDSPVFTYEISADITDINGETRSATTIVKVGYHALIVELAMDDKIDKTSYKNIISVTTKNLNNQDVSAKGSLKIYKLNAPKNVLRDRPWQAPDYQIISKEVFENNFPNESFSNEDKVSNWEKGTQVFNEIFDTSKSTEIPLKRIKNWESGNYIVELTSKDRFGQQVTYKQIFSVFSKSDSKVSDNKLFTISTNKSVYKPSEKVILSMGSASENLFVTIDIEKNNKIINTQIIQLNNEIKQLEIPVTEKDLGGFAIHYNFAGFNSFKSNTLPISVPYPTNEIEIETLTFRDKLQPGQKETWSFKIKGEKGEKVAAELLASMYDASLDQFKPHEWNFNPMQPITFYSSFRRNSAHGFGNGNFKIENFKNPYNHFPKQQFDKLNWFGFHFGNNKNIRIRGMASISNNRVLIVEDSMEVEEAVFEDVPFMYKNNDADLDEVVTVGYSPKKEKIKEPEKFDLSGIQIRKNFNKTSFFYPSLRTDADGNVSFSFTIPEALTRWNLQLLAHTKDVASATKTLTAVTQKELMVLPNPPRFLREGDEIVFSSKISNLTANPVNGFAQLILTDAISGENITERLMSEALEDTNSKETSRTSASNKDTSSNVSVQNFTLDAKGNTNVSWSLKIPEGIQAVQYKIVAKAGEFSDGEQNALPVLSNRMLVTETLPMWVRSNQTKTFTLDKLKNTSTTLSHHKLTLEMTSNPAWYAVQSLPYLIEYPYECAEQTFSRFYANALASHIANSNPRIQEVFNQWKSSGISTGSTSALVSNLEKNPALKSIIIQETPWLRDAQSETEQKKRIALLFDLNKMNNELESESNKLKQLQFSDGGFPWFKGSRYPNRYITQHIASSYGHLKQLNVNLSNYKESEKMMHKAVRFLDDEILDDYTKLLKQAKKLKEQAKTKQKGIKAETDYLANNHLGNIQLQYLYMRSFYSEIEIPSKVKTAIDYYTKQSTTYWTGFNLYSKGMIALIQHRNNNKTIADAILKSLKENSITSEELGMYWKENTSSWYWYQAPIETQALLIEAFSEIKNDSKTIDELKVWLLKNKQTNSWKTTKATTESIYALLLQGSDWLATSTERGRSVNETVEVTVGSQKIEPSKLEDVNIEAGTGYFKTSWNGNEIAPEMGNVTITKKDDGIAWGSLYWQYFEDLDKITSAETPLKLSKKLFLKTNSDTGKQLSEISKETSLKLGDLITVRIELKVDRAMEFVHMKDMRASGLEPINVLSSYKWQDGLGYYENTKDASTNFFMERLPKGIYVFEYDLRVNNAGNFSNGISTIQSMYAPEFSSHSEGVRIRVGN